MRKPPAPIVETGFVYAHIHMHSISLCVSQYGVVALNLIFQNCIFQNIILKIVGFFFKIEFQNWILQIGFFQTWIFQNWIFQILIFPK